MHNRIRESRKAAGMSQKYVAVTLGIAGPSVSNWETGKTKPTNDNIVQLAALFGVTADYLLGLEEVEPTEKAPTPNDMRAEAKRLLENMTDEEYERALAMLKLLQGQK